jgi:hypothetical protein
MGSYLHGEKHGEAIAGGNTKTKVELKKNIKTC